MNTLSREEVLAIVDAQKLRYSGIDLVKAIRVELHAALQLKNPPPYSDNPPALPKGKVGGFTREESDAVRAHQQAQVTDAEHLEFSKARFAHPYITDAHHYVQWKHGTTLWVETDRLMTSLAVP